MCSIVTIVQSECFGTRFFRMSIPRHCMPFFFLTLFLAEYSFVLSYTYFCLKYPLPANKFAHVKNFSYLCTQFVCKVKTQRTVFMKLFHVGSSVGSDVTSSVTSMLPVKLTERQQDMLELIRKNPFISAQQMSVVLSVVKRTIERDLADLQKKGILIREGNTSAGHWEIIEK